MSYLFGKFGASNIGNTSGVTGTVNRGIVFAGGNNVTLSQSVNASSATLTISAANQSVQTQNIHNVTLSGNTAGAMAQVSSGTLTLAGGNNITLSQNANAVTVSAANQTVQTQNLHNVTLGGNTAGALAQISSGTLTLVGGNNITLSQNGNAVTISGGVGGGGGGIALANSQVTFTNGTVNLSATGALTIASTTGSSFQLSVPQTSSLSATGAFSISTNGATVSMGVPAFSAGVSNIGHTAGTTGTASNQIVFAGGDNITLSQSTNAAGNTISISAGGAGGGMLTAFANMLPASTGSQTLGVLGATSGSAQFYPVSIASNVQFNALRVAMMMSFATSTISGRQSVSHSFGLFSNNANTLSLISSNSITYNVTNSSVSATLSAATATGTTGYGYGSITASTTAQIHSLFGTVGAKLIEFEFGNTMSLAAGMYWLGMIRRESSSSANVGVSFGLAGNVMAQFNNVAMMGTASSAQTTNFALRGAYAGFGAYTVTATSLPASAPMSAIAHTGSILPFMTFIST